MAGGHEQDVAGSAPSGREARMDDVRAGPPVDGEPAPSLDDADRAAAAAGSAGTRDGGDGGPVDPRTVPVWRWAALLGCMPAAGTAGIFTLSVTFAGAPIAEIARLVFPLVLAALAFLVWWYPAARYRHLRFRLDDVGITIQDGIVWRTQSALPRVRIQHTDISQGPLQRRYGVATLKLYTAGSRFTRIELPGLAYADAVILRDRLLEAGTGDAV